jgi:hypothetical protein
MYADPQQDFRFVAQRSFSNAAGFAAVSGKGRRVESRILRYKRFGRDYFRMEATSCPTVSTEGIF